MSIWTHLDRFIKSTFCSMFASRWYFFDDPFKGSSMCVCVCCCRHYRVFVWLLFQCFCHALDLIALMYQAHCVYAYQFSCEMIGCYPGCCVWFAQTHDIISIWLITSLNLNQMSFMVCECGFCSKSICFFQCNKIIIVINIQLQLS